MNSIREIVTALESVTDSNGIVAGLTFLFHLLGNKFGFKQLSEAAAKFVDTSKVTPYTSQPNLRLTALDRLMMCFPAMKIPVIRQVRLRTGSGLKEAKDFVEANCESAAGVLSHIDRVSLQRAGLTYIVEAIDRNIETMRVNAQRVYDSNQ